MEALESVAEAALAPGGAIGADLFAEAAGDDIEAATSIGGRMAAAFLRGREALAGGREAASALAAVAGTLLSEPHLAQRLSARLGGALFLAAAERHGGQPDRAASRLAGAIAAAHAAGHAWWELLLAHAAADGSPVARASAAQLRARLASELGGEDDRKAFEACWTAAPAG
jgi:hypothetical protein